MKIAISRTDGGVSIMTTVADADAADALEKWKESHPGEYVSHREVAANELPEDRATRRGWIDSGAAITVDPAKLD